MIVGTSKIDTIELAKHTKSCDDFKEYCISLVPEQFRHLQVVVNNQIYICCLYLRRCNNVDWSRKKEIIKSVLEEVHVVGCTNELIDIGDIIMYLER